VNKKVIILYNQVFDHSNPDEADVLHQVELVSEALHHLGYVTLPFPLSDNLADDMKKIKDEQPVFVFNLVESVFGKGELLYVGPALLNAHQIAYSGNPLDALFITTNKVLAKKNMVASGIPTPAFFQLKQLNQLAPGQRYILKPIWEEGSVGLDEDSVFTLADKEKIERIKHLSESHYFIEAFVEGREFNISLLGGKNKVDVLTPAEMIFHNFPDEKPKILGYKAKWDESSMEYQNTTRSFETLKVESELYNKLVNISKDCWTSFNLKGYARADFRIDQQGNPYVIEINGNPCISPDSGFIAATQHAGLSIDTVIERIIEELN